MDSHIKRKKITTKRKLEQSTDVKKKVKTDIWDNYRYTDTDIIEMNNLIEKYKPGVNITINKRVTRLNIKNRDIIKNSKMLGWVSGTKTKYYLLNDTCIDWMRLYYDKQGLNKINMIKEADHIELLFEGGNKFENTVYKDLKELFGSDFKLVFDGDKINNFLKDRCIDGILREGNDDVKKYMDMGIPIIAQGPLINETNKTYGIADLIVRSDFLEVLFNIFEPDDEIYVNAPKLKCKKYHYRIIDIKWTTLLLCTDGKTLRNQGFFPAYKGQLALYSAALEQLQGYIPNYAYVMGKSWKICKPNIDSKDLSLYTGYSAFDRPGIVSYSDKDKNYVELTKKAIKWIQRVSTEGKEWSYNNDKPSVKEMYPNMKKNINPIYDKIKTHLADKYGELSLCWNVSNNNRNTGYSNGITDIRSDECTIEKLGIKPDKRGCIIEKLISINRHSQTKDIIRPKYIRNNMKYWQEYNKLDIYIDFETINYNLYTKPEDMNIENSYNDTDVAFMIGVGYDYNNQIDTRKILTSLLIDKNKCNTCITLNKKQNWEYVCFYLTDFKVKNEMELFRLLFQFVILREEIYNRLNKSNTKTRLFHWTKAELTIYNKAIERIKKGEYTEHYLSNKNIICERYNKDLVYSEMIKLIEQFDSNIIWVDICDVFQNEPIVIKGSFRFKLKHIGNAFYKNGLINTKWYDGEMSDGFSAMIKAIELYREENKMNNHNKYFKQIINYNEIDCKVIWEIVRYLRNNHC
jgi:hypothetical protein